MKYVRGRRRGFIIFSDSFVHREVANAMLNNDTVISAGFVVSTGDSFVCHGESVSLQIKSREDDTKCLNEQMETK